MLPGPPERARFSKTISIYKKHVNIMKRRIHNEDNGGDEEPSFDITSENDFPSLG